MNYWSLPKALKFKKLIDPIAKTLNYNIAIYGPVLDNNCKLKITSLDLVAIQIDANPFNYTTYLEKLKKFLNLMEQIKPPVRLINRYHRRDDSEIITYAILPKIATNRKKIPESSTFLTVTIQFNR